LFLILTIFDKMSPKDGVLYEKNHKN